jgi:hypothetical protein
MYATVRTYRADPAQMDELLHILDEEFVPRISKPPGLCGYQAIDGGDGTLTTISCFTTEAKAEVSTQLAAEFIVERLARFHIGRTDVTSGEVKVNFANQWLLEPAHA